MKPLVVRRGGLIDKDVLCDHLLGWMPLANVYRGNASNWHGST
jgi:hypothetical protein